MTVSQPAPPLRQVRCIDNLPIPLPDGVTLGARVWLPGDAENRPVGAVLEAQPYRKSDGVAARDAVLGEFFAARGFAFVRLDIRGSGDSEGIIEDEYLPLEQEDNAAVVQWLADQTWCSGAVAMTGISWSGFSALQAAALAPPALKGIAALHFTDDRYSDDVHYNGGCVLAIDMLQWATSMRAYLAQPPVPTVAGESWRERWLERLERTPPFIDPWLSHQRRDEYWQQGSVCEDYSRVKCPVFAIGGWADGYRDTVLRLAEHLSVPVRGVIGPWGHAWPDDGAPGPAAGLMEECVRFFRQVLDGEDNGFLDEPVLTTWMQVGVTPGPCYPMRPGRWVSEPSWPSPNVVVHERPVGQGAVRGLQSTGLAAGVWCGDGGPADAPLDQRPDDGGSLCFDYEPEADRLELLGNVMVRLKLAADRPLALVAARLCDVAPDGASTLIARGVLNLTHRQGHGTVVPVTPGEDMEVTVLMQSTAYAVAPGHRLRLALSPTYWPWAWPSPEPVTLTVSGGTLELPVRVGGADEPAPPTFGDPVQIKPRYEQVSGGTPARSIWRDVATGAMDVKFDWMGDSVTRLTDDGIELLERNVTHYGLVEGDPLSARADCEVVVGIKREDMDIHVEVRSSMTCDRQEFHVTTELKAFEGQQPEPVFLKTDSSRFPRDGG
jgi:uncharacterized protein